VITVYGSRSCTFCKKAVEIATKSFGDVEYKDIGITKYYDELKERGVSTSIQPQVFEDNRLIGTYYHLLKETQERMIED
jgi:glutaredoxin